MPLDLVTVPCLKDNYAYLVHDPASGATAVVDVPETGPVEAALEARGWQLTDILLTHHHHDHVGGVEALRQASGAVVWGAAQDAARLPALDRPVRPDRDEAFAGQTVRIIDVPGHTVGHIAYFFAAAHYLFSGDSLMALGCGRLFEGTPDQMWDSLSRLAALPGDTLVCSGHEYTQTNARFALSLGDVPPALAERAGKIEVARAAGEPTVPVRLDIERATNPFLRATDPGLRAALGLEKESDTNVFAYIRVLKDSF